MKPSRCEGCPLFKVGRGPVYPYTPDNVPACIVVSEAPGSIEVVEQTPLVGPSGRVFRALAYEAGLPVSKCLLTNVVWCQPPHNATPKRNLVEFCTKRWLQPLLDEHPKTKVLALGSTASQYLIGQKITSCAGYRAQRDERSIYFALHPAAVMLDQSQWDSTVRHIARVVNQGKTDLRVADHVLLAPSIALLHDWVRDAQGTNLLTFDVETQGFTHKLRSIALTTDQGMTVSVVWNTHVKEAIRPLLEDPNIAKIAHNIVFDVMALWHNGIEVKGPWHDTMRLAHFNELPKLALRAVVPYYFEVEPWKDTADDNLLYYGAKDSFYTFHVHQQMRKELPTGPLKLWHRTQALEKAVFAMKLRGIQVDAAKLLGIQQQLKGELVKTTAAWREFAGDVNPRSPKQLLEFFNAKGFKMYINRKTGKPTTNEASLVKMSTKGGKLKQCADLLLAQRSVQKMLKTYAAIPIDEDGAVRTSLRVTGTVSGRFSSAEPNMQNIPKSKDKIGFRSVFVARPRYLLYEADLSQAENRVTAILGKEQKMLHAWAIGKDIHKFVASSVWRVREEDVTKEQRTMAKRVNYGLSYGAGPQRIAESAGVTFQAAKRAVSGFKKAFPAYCAQLDWWGERAQTQGYLANAFGRVHHFSGDRVVTQGRNWPAQSTVADIINISICDMFMNLPEDWHLLLQVHDSVLLEVPDIYEPVEVANFCAKYMGRRWPELGKHAIPVEVGYGPTWADVESNLVAPTLEP